MKPEREYFLKGAISMGQKEGKEILPNNHCIINYRNYDKLWEEIKIRGQEGK